MQVEEQLWERAATGDGRSLDSLLARHLPQLHAYVRSRLGGALRARESSMDVVQSVCRQALGERDRFAYRGEECFRAWLFTTALNKIRDKHRRHHGVGRDVRREVRDVAWDELLADDGSTPSQVAIEAERAAAVREALAALRDDHREVITMARLVGLPHAVIAEVMGRSEEATRQLLGRALVQFVVELQRRGIAGC